MLAMFYVEDKIKNLTKSVHYFIVENAVNGKLWPEKHRKYIPNLKMSYLWILIFSDKQKSNIILNFFR
jgi:hypothetical protein